MNQPKIEIFDYDEEIGKLPEEWQEDMAIVFREFDEDSDGVIDSQTATHIFNLFRLPSKGLFSSDKPVRMKDFLYEASLCRDEIFSSPTKRYIYYFQMIAGLGQTTISGIDLQRFFTVNGDKIDLKFCEDFIDEFDREYISKDTISIEEFCDFCSKKKIPV